MSRQLREQKSFITKDIEAALGNSIIETKKQYRLASNLL
jgi:hypothetical protein